LEAAIAAVEVELAVWGNAQTVEIKRTESRLLNETILNERLS